MTKLDSDIYNTTALSYTMPSRIQGLPVSAKGFPVPWFVQWFDNVPDFRVIDSGKMRLAWKQKLCWICGQRLGQYVALVLGPMCAVNRCISEPASHRECAVYAARACPFLANPRAQRHEAGLPEERVEPYGIHIARNPGAAAVWIINKDGYRPFTVEGGGELFNFDDPLEVEWYAEGQQANYAQVKASIDSGLEILLPKIPLNDRREMQRLLNSTLMYLPHPQTGRFYVRELGR